MLSHQINKLKGYARCQQMLRRSREFTIPTKHPFIHILSYPGIQSFSEGKVVSFSLEKFVEVLGTSGCGASTGGKRRRRHIAR